MIRITFSPQTKFSLVEEQVAEYKEVFTLFDKDKNGILSFTETKLAVRTLGQCHTGGQAQ